MTVVSSKEFSTNQDKFFDLALDEQVYIQNGNNTFLLMYKNVDDKKMSPRHDWATAAKEFVESGNEESFFPDIFDDEDLNWWKWEQK